MAARSPRKTFARSFVVTIATIPACYTETAPPPQQPQQPVVQQTAPPRPDEATVVTNPPRPSPGGTAQTDPPPPSQPQTYTFDQRWTVMKSGTTCSAMAKVDCPKPTRPGGPVPTCNPPPPMKIECPANWDGKTPLPVVQYANQSVCMVEQAPVKCPPNVACNPPPPQKVACPTYQ